MDSGYVRGAPALLTWRLPSAGLGAGRDIARCAATAPATFSAPAISGAAETLRRIPAPEARQGVAVGPKDVFAVAN